MHLSADGVEIAEVTHARCLLVVVQNDCRGTFRWHGLTTVANNRGLSARS